MKLLKNLVGSMPSMAILLLIFALGCAVATFIENDFGTDTAKAFVYNALWFEVVMALLAVNLIFNTVHYQLWRREKCFSLLIHLAFVVILLGAGITRYFGQEGSMHIREGETIGYLLSDRPYLQIAADVQGQQFRWEKNFVPFLVSKQPLTHTVKLGEQRLQLTVKPGPKKMGNTQAPLGAAMIVVLTYQGKTQEVSLFGGSSTQASMEKIKLGDLDIAIGWGAKPIPLPFALQLKKFKLERYPGSMSPSSFESEVIVIDKEQNWQFPYRIYMNHILDYRSYRFFQSSYDQDELGTILTVTNDPGRYPTYLGYLLLAIGLFLNLFHPKSRFREVSVLLKNSRSTAMVMALVLLGIAALAPQAMAQHDGHQHQQPGQEPAMSTSTSTGSHSKPSTAAEFIFINIIIN